MENFGIMYNGNMNQGGSSVAPCCNGANQYISPVGGPVLVNPYNGMPVSQDAAEKLFFQSSLMKQKGFQDRQLMELQNHYKLQQTELKAQIAIKRDEAIAIRKMIWEESTLYPVEDSSGRICLERSFQNGNKNVGNPIFKYGGIKVTKINAIGSNNTLKYRVSWVDIDEMIFLEPVDMVPKNLFKRMLLAGNPLLIGKNRKAEIAELVFGYLCDHADVIYVPEHWGWIYGENKWKFYPDKCSTLDESDNEMSSDAIMDMKLIKSIVINAPILRAWELSFSKLLTIIVPTGQTERFFNIMKTPESVRLNMFSNREVINKALLSAHSSATLITYYYSEKSKEQLDYIWAVWNTGMIGNRPIVSTPVLVTESCIPPDPDGRLFFINLNESLKDKCIGNEEVIPPADMLPVILDNIEKISDNASEIENILVAAAYFMYPMVKKENMTRLINRVHTLYQQDDELHDHNGLGECFIDTLFTYLDRNNFSAVFPVNYVNADIEETKDKAIFYCDNYIYMSEYLFKEITKPLVQNGILLDFLKQSLRDEGTLVSNSSNVTYTVKVTMTSDGKKIRLRMLRFDRKKMHEDGRAEIIDICEIRKESKKNG